ncbi:MAG: multiheme c-type cytochrome, partial [Verrucomicrobiota bacterium]
ERPASPASASAADAPPSTEAGVFAGYAGSAACRECHAEAWQAWQDSHHALAERPWEPALDDAAFAPSAHRPAHLGAEPDRGPDGQARIVTAGLDCRPRGFAVGRVIGHDPLRQYLIDVGAGRWQTASASWDPHRGEWFDVFGAESRQPGDWGHWTGRGMTWNSQCASCHNTRVRKNYDPATDGFRTAMAGRTVGCEACHGPGRAHAEWRRTHPGGQSAEPGHARLTRAQHLDACGSCHARRTELTGDFVPGDRFDDHFGLVTVDETDTYHADGQVRDENYEFGSFAGSRMGAAGVHCLDCHQPHTGKRLLPGDALCQRCHAAGLSGAPVIVPSAHTFHRSDSPGARCENCHLPQTTYMQRHPRHDHGFTIPDPALTRELGIPNACNRCHDDRDVAWAEEAANRWYGRRLERPTRARARVVAAARRGDPGARAGLLELATRTQHPPY